ncbi:MAG: phosphoglycerate kinase, partial [Rhodospirillales bacterium]
MTTFKTIDTFDLAGKKVLLRADLNVPMKDGAVTDMTRITRTMPTIEELASKGAIVIVTSHLGRPKGQVNPDFSLAPVAKALGAALGRDVPFASDTVGGSAKAVVAAAKAGDVVMLENLRFHAEEEKNDAGFAGRLAALADIYVSDAFSCAHRAHASTEAIAKLLPSAAGRLMQAELEALEGALGNPAHPVTAVVGGAKVSTKMDVLGNLIAKVDRVIIGGGMANTFLFAQGINVGKSLCGT